MTEIPTKLNIFLRKGQLDKAAETLTDFHNLSEDSQKKILEILALTSNKTAITLLTSLLMNKNLDENTKEALLMLVADRAHIHSPFVLLLLQFAPYILINQSVPLIRHILSHDTDANLLGQIITTAGDKKINALTQDLAEYTFYGESRLKSLAIQALKRISSPDALECLKKIAATEKCDQEVLDAIDVLESKIPAISRQVGSPDLKPGFSPEDEAAFRALTSENPQKQFQAFRYFAQSKDRVFQAICRAEETEDLSSHTILLRLVAITTPPEAIEFLLKILNSGNPSTGLKFIVYNALQAYPDIMGSASLIQGAVDSSSHIRIAAIKMLNNHCTDFIIAEIKKKIESGTRIGETLAISIIEARAGNIIEKLMASDSFFYILSHYIENTASLLIIDFFIEIFEKREMKSQVRKYKALRQQRKGKNLPEVMIINPSSACLDACATKITQAGGEPILFQSTQPAFEKLMAEKPSALILGIFLHDMHCIDFIKEVRTLYTKKQLPIIVSSIIPVDIGQWEKQTGNAGMTAWCNFPPKPSQIKSWISDKK